MSDNEPLRGQPAATAEILSLQSRSGDRPAGADLPDNVTVLAPAAPPASGPAASPGEHLRIVEAVLFAASEPLDEASLAERLPEGADLSALLRELQAHYAGRGVNLVRVAGKWCFRTAEDLAFVMRREATEAKRLSRAALETLAIIAYHQPTTRAEIEDIRGVAVSKGTIDVLMEAGWIKIKGRRQAPGRPVTFGTTDEFLRHFGLNSVKDLPGMDELKAAGLLRSDPPDGFEVPAEDEDEEEDETEAQFDFEGDEAAFDLDAEFEAEAEVQAETQSQAESETEPNDEPNQSDLAGHTELDDGLDDPNRT